MKRFHENKNNNYARQQPTIFLHNEPKNNNHHIQSRHVDREHTMFDGGSERTKTTTVTDATSCITEMQPSVCASPRQRRKLKHIQVAEHDSRTLIQNMQAAKQVIDELKRSTGHNQRTEAITNACAEFDHDDEDKHNSELQCGAATVLVNTLCMTNDDDEIRMFCAAIEMVFRGSSKYVQVAFEKVGSTMIPLLLNLLWRCETRNIKHADVSILNISKTLLHLSRIEELRVYLARQPGMLDAMRRVAISNLNSDCRIVRARIVANLANCDENKILMFEYEGLVDSILRIGFLDPSEIVREYASYAIMELMLARANQALDAKNEKLLGTLIKMILVERIAATRDAALIVLENLAMVKGNRSVLVNFKGGIVLEAMKRALNTDKNGMVRQRVATVLTNLVCLETARRMGNHKGLLGTLAIVAVKDKSDKVQMGSALALTKLSSYITVGMECYEEMLDALVVASLSKCSNNVSAVMRAKARDEQNRKSMARHTGILDTLADTCVNPESSLKDKDNAMHAIMHLTNEQWNRHIVCKKTILDALVLGASANSPEMKGIRRSAMRAIERLAIEYSNRQYMAKHDGLLVAIARAAETEAKLEESGESIDQSFLAKPILMSLLVAL